MELPRVRRAGTAGEGGTSGADRAKLRRTWPQRLLIMFNSCLVVVCLISAWTLSFYQRQISGIRRVPLQGVLDHQEDPTDPVNVLLVGSDSTGNDDPQAPENAGRLGVHHADSISILRVDPDRREVELLSLPRDLWVRIPGRSGTYKLSEALAYANPPGNPELLIQTIQTSFEVPVHYFVQVDFAAFRGLVDALDGVNLWFDRRARDRQVGLSVDEPGCRLASGEEALAFARSRYYEELDDDGRWRMDPTYDIGRIARQQYFIKQAAKKAIARGARNPVELANLIGQAQQYVLIDDALTPQMILDLVSHFNTFHPDDLQVFQPYTERLVRPVTGGDGQVLLVAESQPVLDRFRETPAVPTADPGAGSVPATEAPLPGEPSPSLWGEPAPATTRPPPDESSFVPNPPPEVAC